MLALQDEAYINVFESWSRYANISMYIYKDDVRLLYRKEPRTAAAFLLNWKRKRYSKIFYEIK